MFVIRTKDEELILGFLLVELFGITWGQASRVIRSGSIKINRNVIKDPNWPVPKNSVFTFETRSGATKQVFVLSE